VIGQDFDMLRGEVNAEDSTIIKEIRSSSYR
jgi:hypothetical protein